VNGQASSLWLEISSNSGFWFGEICPFSGSEVTWASFPRGGRIWYIFHVFHTSLREYLSKGWTFRDVVIQQLLAPLSVNFRVACEPPAGPVPQPPSPSGLFCDQNANIGVDIFILIVGFMSGSTCKQISRRWRPGWAIKSSVEYLLNFLNSGRERSLQMEKVRFASWTDEGIELWIEKYKSLWLRAVYQYDGEGVFR
jgi:hypothetical protein